jgi:23S rRNA (guanine745-N1)-methyltransferase
LPGHGIIDAVLAEVVPYLRCPVCGDGLHSTGDALGCGHGHRFDVARQGYVSLLPGDARAGTADTAQMVTARVDLLGSGAFSPLTEAVATAVADTLGARGGDDGCLVDAGGGTGHHLAAVLDRCPPLVGVTCDLSRYAARRAARAHPRMGAVVADVWRGLPLRDGCATAVLNVFAPRNGSEFHRVLRADGILVVVTPLPEHLGEAVRRLDLLSVDADKPRRLHESLERSFVPADEVEVRWSMPLSRAALGTLVRMGPSAWHSPDLDARLAEVPEPLEVGAAVRVSTFRPRRSGAVAGR